MHSKKFEKVRAYYEKYLNGDPSGWSKEMVRASVGKWITAEEYEEITGEAYEE